MDVNLTVIETNFYKLLVAKNFFQMLWDFNIHFEINFTVIHGQCCDWKIFMFLRFSVCHSLVIYYCWKVGQVYLLKFWALTDWGQFLFVCSNVHYWGLYTVCVHPTNLERNPRQLSALHMMILLKRIQTAGTSNVYNYDYLSHHSSDYWLTEYRNSFSMSQYNIIYV